MSVQDIMVNVLNSFLAADYQWRMLAIAAFQVAFSVLTFIEQPFHSANTNMIESVTSLCVALVAVLLAVGPNGLRARLCPTADNTPPNAGIGRVPDRNDLRIRHASLESS